jgi:hypothetical protein
MVTGVADAGRTAANRARVAPRTRVGSARTRITGSPDDIGIGKEVTKLFLLLVAFQQAACLF